MHDNLYQFHWHDVASHSLHQVKRDLGTAEQSPGQILAPASLYA